MSMIERATDITKSCILPALKFKIGEALLNEKYFANYLPILRNNLETLLDIFHANEHELLTIDLDTFEFRTNFVIVLCEQATTHFTYFQCADVAILETLRKLCHKYVLKMCQDDEKLLQNLFEYYHKVLNKENWRLNFGGLNGFLTFIQQLYGNYIDSTSNLCLDYDKAQFILATGLHFLDHFEPNVQIIGIQLFNVLLNERNLRNVAEYNINEVIFEDIRKLILKSKEIDFERELWQCLLSCCMIEIKTYKPEKWSKYDDTFESLIKKLALESEKSLSLLYLNYALKFSVLGESNFDEFEAFLDIEHIKSQILNIHKKINEDKTYKWELFEVFRSYRKKETPANLRIFRWIKKLIVLLQNEVLKVGGDEIIVGTHINALHIFYCLTIFTVPIQILQRDFLNFITKFITSLLEAYQIFKGDYFICQSITELLMTIQVHLSRDTEALDPKIAQLIQKLMISRDDESEIRDESVLKDIKEVEKGLTLLLRNNLSKLD